VTSAERENVLNEVIRDLTLLMRVTRYESSGAYAPGIRLASEWVRAMRSEENDD
jgi:hypothetical protein